MTNDCEAQNFIDWPMKALPCWWFVSWSWLWWSRFRRWV